MRARLGGGGPGPLEVRRRQADPQDLQAGDAEVGVLEEALDVEGLRPGRGGDLNGVAGPVAADGAQQVGHPHGALHRRRGGGGDRAAPQVAGLVRVPHGGHDAERAPVEGHRDLVDEGAGGLGPGHGGVGPDDPLQLRGRAGRGEDGDRIGRMPPLRQDLGLARELLEQHDGGVAQEPDHDGQDDDGRRQRPVPAQVAADQQGRGAHPQHPHHPISARKAVRAAVRAASSGPRRSPRSSSPRIFPSRR